MKKFLTALFFLFLVTSCGAPTNVDKLDEKGYNPSPEQILEPSVPAPVVQETQDSIGL